MAEISLDGREGNDRIEGEVGDDTLIGGIGNDVVNGGAGNNSITGGSTNPHHRSRSVQADVATFADRAALAAADIVMQA